MDPDEKLVHEAFDAFWARLLPKLEKNKGGELKLLMKLAFTSGAEFGVKALADIYETNRGFESETDHGG